MNWLSRHHSTFLPALLFVACVSQVAYGQIRDTVTAVVLADFPPLYSLNAEQEPSGFAIELLEKVAQRAGLAVDYLVVQNWAEAMRAVRDGEADLIPGIGISPTRQSEFLFSSEMEAIPVSMFVRDESDLDGLGAHIGMKIAVINQSAAHTRLLHRDDISLVAYPSIDPALFALLAGDVDSFVFPQPVLLHKARRVGVEGMIKVVGKPIIELKRGYLFRHDDQELLARIDPALFDTVSSPFYGELLTRWYWEPQPFWTVNRVVVFFTVLLSASIAAVLLWRHVSLLRLNRELAKSTELLEQRVQERTHNLADEVDMKKRAELSLLRKNEALACIDSLRASFINETNPFVMYGKFLDELLKLTRSQYGFVGDIVTEEGGGQYIKMYAISNLAWNDATRQIYEKLESDEFEFRTLDNMIGEVVKTCAAVISNDAHNDPRGSGIPAGHPSIDSFFGTPVFFGERMVGVVGLANRSEGFDEEFRQEIQPVIGALGQITVARWERQARDEAEKVIHELAVTDALTGIANRHQYEIHLNRCIAEVERHREPLSLLMIDVDLFKEINDQHGHDFGDQVLLEFARLASSLTRDADLFARWGGEEFAVLLPRTDSARATNLAERIRTSVEAHPFPRDQHMTVSIGVATLTPDDDAERLASRADAALYRAKESGRNRVFAASDEATSPAAAVAGEQRRVH